MPSRRPIPWCQLGPGHFAVWAWLILTYIVSTTDAVHHMKRDPLVFVNRRDDKRPLRITNLCPEVLHPGIGTQAGTAPETHGFALGVGETRDLTVSGDWQGRVWGRTNCSFNAKGTGPSHPGGLNGGGASCGTGDCGGVLDCKLTVSFVQTLRRKLKLTLSEGATPVTLAEFTLSSSSGQAFYDISLVDGYNLPMAIVSLYPESKNSSLTRIPPNLTNPVCIGTAALLAGIGSTDDATLGSNSSFPLPLDQKITSDDVQRWCPWDLQQNPPEKPGDGVYPYPDDDIQRPLFNPCFSACAKFNKPEDCCTNEYNDPKVCKPSLYSEHAKRVCPDAYSFGKLTFYLHHYSNAYANDYQSIRRSDLNIHHPVRRRIRRDILSRWSFNEDPSYYEQRTA